MRKDTRRGILLRRGGGWRWVRTGPLAALAVGFAVGAAGCAHPMGLEDVTPPPQAEFGYGPRISAEGLFQAWIEPLQPIRVGQMHSWKLEVKDASDGPVSGANIVVGGGMPQHGHGLPTKPRVTMELGAGAYRVEGIRFNMGGWWVVTFGITTPSGSDLVTFNLSL